MEKKVLTVDDKISLGQCFNLAHAAMLKAEINAQKDVFLTETTIDLFKIKKRIQERLETELGHDVP